MSGIVEAYKTMIFALSKDSTIAALGGKVDCGLFNPTRNDAKWSARFPLDFLVFGDTQTDGAGVAQPVHFFAVVARMKLNEEMTQGELDFVELNEAIKSIFHRARWNEAYSTIWQKSMVFYTTMTVTNETRRFQLKLEDDEVGLVVFCYASDLTVAALANEAEVPETEDDTGRISISVDGGKVVTEEEEAVTPSETEKELGSKVVSKATQVF